MTGKAPAPFTYAWHRQQPPERLARSVRRFQRKKEGMDPIKRRFLEEHGCDMPLEVAEQIDRDLERLLPTYGAHYPPSGLLCRDIKDMAQEAAALHRDLCRYEHGTETMKARALEKPPEWCFRRAQAKVQSGDYDPD